MEFRSSVAVYRRAGGQRRGRAASSETGPQVRQFDGRVSRVRENTSSVESALRSFPRSHGEEAVQSGVDRVYERTRRSRKEKNKREAWDDYEQRYGTKQKSIRGNRVYNL